MNARILVIEDEKDINDLVTIHLRDMHLEVVQCNHGEQGFHLAQQENFDLIILDLMLPGMDGLDVCRNLRAIENFTPILMLTSRNSEMDRVIGLEMGADDYLTKPFSVRELQARVKAILRRMSQLKKPKEKDKAAETLVFEGLHIVVDKRQVKLDGTTLELTSTEFDLLLYLAKHPGQVFSRTQLLDTVWGYKYSGYEHTVNSHINRLRSKIEKNPSKPKYIITVWGVGYKFNDEISD